MKKLLLLTLALATTLGASAQVYRPNVSRHSPRDHRAAPAHRSSYHRGHAPSHRPIVFVSARPYGYYTPSLWYDAPYYPYTGYGYAGYRYSEPSGAGTGMLLGGLLGAIIGNNSGSLGHNGWRGAAWGALAGSVIGSIHDASVHRSRPAPAPARAYEDAGAPAPAAPAPTTIINNYYVTTPMSGANVLFGRP